MAEPESLSSSSVRRRLSKFRSQRVLLLLHLHIRVQAHLYLRVDPALSVRRLHTCESPYLHLEPVQHSKHCSLIYHSSARSSTKSPPRFKAFVCLPIVLRTFRLRILSALTIKHERPKVAIQQGSHEGLGSMSCHVVPLVGALALIALNLESYYIGPKVQSGGLTALQFVAKFHELLMIALLTAVYSTYARAELTSEAGLLFGAASTGLQASNPSYLWSPEFMAGLTSKPYTWAFKMRFALTTIFIFALAITVGPASAACMIPRDDVWPIGHTPSTSAFRRNFNDNSISVNLGLDEMFSTNLTSDLYFNNCSLLLREDNTVDPCPGISNRTYGLPCPFTYNFSGNLTLRSLTQLMVPLLVTDSQTWGIADPTTPLPLTMYAYLNGNASTRASNTTGNRKLTTSTQHAVLALLAQVCTRNLPYGFYSDLTYPRSMLLILAASMENLRQVMKRFCKRQ